MRISDLQKRTKPFEALLDEGVVIKGEFRPNGLTTKMLERLVGLSSKDGSPEFAPTVLSESLADLLVSWDLTDDNDVPIAPTLDAIKDNLSPTYQRTLYDKLAELMRPNLTSAETSGAG